MTHTTQNEEMIKQKIYKILYKKSLISFGVRCLNEDEWPIEEIAKFICETTEKSYQEGFDNGAQEAANEVTDAIACGRY